MAEGKSSMVSCARQIPLPTVHNFKDITGQRFGRLMVLAYAGRLPGHNESAWLCLCDCGSEVVVSKSPLRLGATRSCGCLGSEVTAKRNFRHGMLDAPEYPVWASMKARCADLANKDYGGRGIRVCDRWVNSFANFLADVGPRPSPRHEIDRFPDNNGDYRPGNCRWVKRLSNMRNTRRNRRLVFNGKSLCVSEWEETTGIPATTILKRLRLGWEISRVLTTPVRRKARAAT